MPGRVVQAYSQQLYVDGFFNAVSHQKVTGLHGNLTWRLQLH